MERLSIEAFKQYVEEFMVKNNLRGLEVIRPSYTDEIYFRAAGKGRHDTGLEIWSSINDMLKGEDHEEEPEMEYYRPKKRIHEIRVVKKQA